MKFYNVYDISANIGQELYNPVYGVHEAIIDKTNHRYDTNFGFYDQYGFQEHQRIFDGFMHDVITDNSSRLLP
jgi:hypothetical protein